jgi:hypothetical protein
MLILILSLRLISVLISNFNAKANFNFKSIRAICKQQANCAHSRYLKQNS